MNIPRSGEAAEGGGDERGAKFAGNGTGPRRLERNSWLGSRARPRDVAVQDGRKRVRERWSMPTRDGGCWPAFEQAECPLLTLRRSLDNGDFGDRVLVRGEGWRVRPDGKIADRIERETGWPSIAGRSYPATRRVRRDGSRPPISLPGDPSSSKSSLGGFERPGMGDTCPPADDSSHLDVTRHAIPQGQGLQLLVGQLRDIADVHRCCMAGFRLLRRARRPPTIFEFEPNSAFSAKRRKVTSPGGARSAIGIHHVGRGEGGGSGTNQRRDDYRLAPCVARSGIPLIAGSGGSSSIAPRIRTRRFRPGRARLSGIAI